MRAFVRAHWAMPQGTVFSPAKISARWVTAILCGGYFALLATGLAGPGPPPGAGFDTLAGVRLLLSTPEALLAGWVHYLAFDLFIGAWQAEDAPAARKPDGSRIDPGACFALIVPATGK